MRIMFIISLLFAASLAAATATETGNPEKDVARFYDLSGCLGSFEQDLSRGGQKLMPMAFKCDAPEEYNETGHNVVSLDQIYQLVWSLIGEEYFEHNGARIEEAGNRLFVKCPEDMHRKVAALLQFMEQRLNQSVTIRIDLLEREAPLPDDMDARALRLALDEGRIQPLYSRSATTRIGDHFRVRIGEYHRIIMDYEPEIAESSAIAEPITHPLFVGLDIEAKPLLAADGQNIIMGFYGLFSRLTGPIMVREVKGASRLGTDSGLQEFTTDNVLEDPRVEFGSLGSTLFLKNGVPSLVRAAFPHLDGSGDLLLIVSATLDDANQTMDLGGGLILAAHDLSYFQASKISPYLWRNEEEWGLEGGAIGPLTEIPMMRLGPNYGPYEELIDLFTHGDNFPELGFDEHSEKMNHDVMGRLFLFGTTPGQYEAFKRLTREMYQPFSKSADVEVLFLEVDGPPILTEANTVLDRGTPKGAVSMPLMPGARAVGLAGLEGLMIYSYDVDVATKACIMNPNTASYLDGAMVLLDHSPSLSGNGTGQIRFQMNLNCLKGPMQSLYIAKYGGLIGVLDKPEFQHALVDTVFADDGEMHLLGSLPLEGKTGMSTLYALGRVKK